MASEVFIDFIVSDGYNYGNGVKNFTYGRMEISQEILVIFCDTRNTHARF